MTDPRQDERERVAREIADRLNRMEASEYDGYDEFLDAQQAVVLLFLKATEAATLEEAAEIVISHTCDNEFCECSAVANAAENIKNLAKERRS
jgi:hypothetical protein